MPELLISEVFPPQIGGSGRFYWEVYRRLSRVDYLVAAGRYPGCEEFDKTHDLRLRRLPLTMSCWGLKSLSGLRGYFGALKRLWPIVRSERIGLIHCGRCLPEGVMALALKATLRIPYMTYVWGEDINGALTSRELTILARAVLHNAKYIITCSKNTERLLLEDWGIPADRIRLQPPGVDAGRFTPAPRNLEIRTKLGWGDRPVILTVGRLQKRKGFDQMILALKTIRQAIPNVLYAIVGDGEERANIEALIDAEGMREHVLLMGEMGLDSGGLLDCYRQCDLFALPNRQVGKDIEGFGMVLIEAQACGKPVLAGASGGTAETMSVPDTGVIVNCEGPDQLASQVIELLSDPDRLARMGEAARRWVVDRFDWPAIGRGAEAIFREAGADLATVDESRSLRDPLAVESRIAAAPNSGA